MPISQLPLNILFIQEILPFIRILSIILIPFGVLLLLYGYKLFKIFIAFIGFIFGFALGAVIGALADQIILMGILGGALGALLFYLLYKIGIFLLGFAAGSFLGILLAAISGELEPFIWLIMAIAGGIFALFIEKVIIVTISSYQGASIIVSGFTWLFYPEFQYILYSLINNFDAYISYLSTQILITLILMVVGILYQYEYISNKADKYLPEAIRNKVADNTSKTSDRTDDNIDSEPLQPVTPDIISTDKSSDGQIYVNPVEYKYSGYTPETQLSKPHAEIELKEDFKNFEHKIATETNNNSFNLNTNHNSIKLPVCLVALSGSNAGLRLPLFGVRKNDYYAATIGRQYSDRANHIQIDESNLHISRIHAEIALKDDFCYIRRLSETNPLYLNSVEINDSVFQPIKDQDIITMGNIQIRVLSNN